MYYSQTKFCPQRYTLFLNKSGSVGIKNQKTTRNRLRYENILYICNRKLIS